jgi:hypothetical protein
MSWKPEVIADSSGVWCSNGLTFETQKEAEDYVRDLSWRWTAVRKTRVINADMPATHSWHGDSARALS